MICSICGKSESDFEGDFREISSKLKKAVVAIDAELNNRIDDTNNQILRSIDDDLKKITIDAFFSNKNYFMKQEPKLKIMDERYLENFRSTHSTHKYRTLNDLIESFCSEIDFSISGSASKLLLKRNDIELVIKMLDSQRNFIKTSVKFNLNCNDKNDKNLAASLIKEYCPEDFDNLTSIILCPICDSLIKETANGAYHAIQQCYDD